MVTPFTCYFLYIHRQSMVALTREERKRRVLELHNQGMGTREIAQNLQMSFRDFSTSQPFPLESSQCGCVGD